MDLEAGNQLLAPGDNKAKLKSLPYLKRNEHEPCFARRYIKTPISRIGRYLAATVSFLASLVANDTQNSTWLTPIIDLYTWKTFHELATMKVMDYFEGFQVLVSNFPYAVVSLATVPTICLYGSPTDPSAEHLDFSGILDRVSNTSPAFQNFIYCLTIGWTIFTGISIIHYFLKTKSRLASIPGFSMEHLFRTQLKLVAIGADLSFINALICAKNIFQWLSFPLIYILLFLIIGYHWTTWGSIWDDKELMEYFSNNSDDIEVEALYEAYKKENPDEEHELPTITERNQNIGGSANEDARHVENPGGEASKPVNHSYC